MDWLWIYMLVSLFLGAFAAIAMWAGEKPDLGWWQPVGLGLFAALTWPLAFGIMLSGYRSKYAHHWDKEDGWWM